MLFHLEVDSFFRGLSSPQSSINRIYEVFSSVPEDSKTMIQFLLIFHPNSTLVSGPVDMYDLVCCNRENKENINRSFMGYKMKKYKYIQTKTV